MEIPWQSLDNHRIQVKQYRTVHCTLTPFEQQVNKQFYYSIRFQSENRWLILARLLNTLSVSTRSFSLACYLSRVSWLPFVRMYTCERAIAPKWKKQLVIKDKSTLTLYFYCPFSTMQSNAPLNSKRIMPLLRFGLLRPFSCDMRKALLIPIYRSAAIAVESRYEIINSLIYTAAMMHFH